MKSWQVCLGDQWVSHFAWEISKLLPFTWATNGSLPSVQNYRPYIVFSSPMWKYEHPLCFTYWLVIGTYILMGFFLVICWSYLRMEIFFTLSIGNKSSSSSSSFIFSFLWPTLLMLSCDHIEPAKFIHGTLSLAKIIYYSTWTTWNLSRRMKHTKFSEILIYKRVT